MVAAGVEGPLPSLGAAAPRCERDAQTEEDDTDMAEQLEAAAGPQGALVCAGSRAVMAPVGRGGVNRKAGPAGHAHIMPRIACLVAIQELDEEAIELIFTFLPPKDRSSAAAVCRLWRRVHNSSTKLWGSVLLSGERIVHAAASASAGSIATWLGARLEAMRAVRLWSPGHPLESFATGLAQLLSREGLPRLQAFSYAGADASVSRLLAELPSLTSLQLLDILSPFGLAGQGQGLVVRAKELARLKPLRNLLSLQLHAREIRGSLPPALFRCLNRLQHLAISAKCRLPAAVVRQLTGLHSLELHGACMDNAAAEAAGCLQQLTRLSFSVQAWSQGEQASGSSSGAGGADSGGPSGGGAGRRRGGGGSKCAGGGAVQRWQAHPIWGQLPLLSRLQELAVGAELPEPEQGLPGSEDGGGPGGAAVLSYDQLDCSVPDGIMDCSALTHLVLPVALTALPDLVPGQLPSLAALDLTHSIVEALPPSWCCNMQSLRHLVLNGAQVAGSRLPAEFAALQSLRHLEMRACRLEVLPACVAQLSGLIYLDVGINRLADLPPGPYLSELRVLAAQGNCLRSLPPALAEAQQLEVLDVGENEGLLLQAGDVDGVLACMPALRHLVVTRQPSSGFGFAPYISAGNGAAWDAPSVGVLMQLARTLPALSVHLERGTLPMAHCPTPQQ